MSRVLEFASNVVKNLPDVSPETMKWWNVHPLELQKHLACLSQIHFTVWRTVKLGVPGLKSADDLRKAMKKAGMKSSDWANDMLGQSAFTVSTEEMEVDLVRVTVEELGFREATRYDKICERGIELGLQLCPNEVGPQLRLQYKDQPLNEWIRVAMEAIRDSDGDLRLFCVEHGDGDLWLYCSYVDPGSLYGPDDVFVFVRPRK